MARREIWLRCLGEEGPAASRIREYLTAFGLDLVPEDGAERHCVLCFARVDNELLHIAHEFRDRPRARLLAVAEYPWLLENGAAWRLLHAGASDVLAWQDGDTAERIAARLERWHAIEEATARAIAREPMAGGGRAWLTLVRKVVEAARFSRIPILLTGESGTGKELLARLIHAAACDAAEVAPSRGLVTVDCATIVPELSGSELFGHERGAFTGAHALREGAFALADGATLFLDEVGELPLHLQSQLLRAIQERTYKRVGGNAWLKTNFRLVCATNRDLPALVERGQFRLDLYHRIAGWVFRTLRLEERRDDIVPLARYFLQARRPDDPPELEDAVCDYLVNRAYPGNIRELRQLMERIANRHAGPGPITAGDIPEEERPAENGVCRAWPDERLDRTIADAIELGASLREISAATTSAAIRIAVQSEGGNLQRAAKRLGVTDRALQLRRAAGTLRD